MLRLALSLATCAASSKRAAREVAGLELDAEPVGRELGEAAPGRSRRPGTAPRPASICSSIMSRMRQLAVAAVEDLLPVAVDPLALVVHHLVVFEQVLADVEVALLDLLLGRLDAPR